MRNTARLLGHRNLSSPSSASIRNVSNEVAQLEWSTGFQPAGEAFAVRPSIHGSRLIKWQTANRERLTLSLQAAEPTL